MSKHLGESTKLQFEPAKTGLYIQEAQQIINSQPYNAAANGDTPELIIPLIKHGVNPSTGRPILTNFIGDCIIPVIGARDGKYPGAGLDILNPVVVGETSAMLSTVFFNRAKNLFSNMINTMNIAINRDMGSRYPELCDALGEYDRYATCDRHSIKRNLSLISNHLFFTYCFDYEGNQERTCLSDLLYYSIMPLPVILDAGLAQIATEYTRVYRDIDSLCSSPIYQKFMSTEYGNIMNDITAVFATLTDNMEYIVIALYEEMRNVFIPAGFDNSGISYKSLVNITTKLSLENYEKCFVGKN